MPDYSYTAIDTLGNRVRGVTVADNEAALEHALRAEGQYLVRTERPREGSLADIRVFERVNRRDVIFFTSQLASVVGTGLNLIEGLTEIERQITKRPMQRVVRRLREDIESGMSLSDALSRHPKAFDDLYVSIVKAGEATGKAERALEDLVVQLEWQEDVRSRIRDASIYPVIVVVLLVVVTAVLVNFTIPRFMQVYESVATQVEMPLPTRAVMAVTGFLRANVIGILAGLAALVIFIRLQFETPDGKARMHRWLLQLPVVGELSRKLALSRFAHYFGLLHESGLEVAPSMTLVERLIGNAHLERQFRRAVDRVMAGQPLSRALAAVGEFPPVVIQMIALGERTGQMSRALEDVRRYYDKEVERGVRQSLTYFGPAMLIVLAFVFVTMAVAFYLPLFRMVRAISGAAAAGGQAPLQ